MPMATTAPRPGGIIHLGATSCYVTDNTDLILLRESLELLRSRLVAGSIDWPNLPRDIAIWPAWGLPIFSRPSRRRWASGPACGRTTWCRIWTRSSTVWPRSRPAASKGRPAPRPAFSSCSPATTPRSAGSTNSCAGKMGFAASYPVTGQTYSRKVDAQVLATLCGIAQSAHKAAIDWRLLQSRKEIEEPFEQDQIGSSAMAYKRNPMRAERMCGLARFVISLESSAAETAATQWLERTLDDSANRRLTLPQALLAIDAILILYQNVAAGFVVYPQVIARHLAEELPFMATENILMAAVAAGGDRQELHERIRRHSQAAAAVVKQHGRANDLLDRLRGDSAFAAVNLDAAMAPARFVGRAPEQVDEFLATIVAPIQARYTNALTTKGTVSI